MSLSSACSSVHKRKLTSMCSYLLMTTCTIGEECPNLMGNHVCPRLRALSMAKFVSGAHMS